MSSGKIEFTTTANTRRPPPSYSPEAPEKRTNTPVSSLKQLKRSLLIFFFSERTRTPVFLSHCFWLLYHFQLTLSSTTSGSQVIKIYQASIRNIREKNRKIRIEYKFERMKLPTSVHFCILKRQKITFYGENNSKPRNRRTVVLQTTNE